MLEYAIIFYIMAAVFMTGVAFGAAEMAIAYGKEADWKLVPSSLLVGLIWPASLPVFVIALMEESQQ